MSDDVLRIGQAIQVPLKYVSLSVLVVQTATLVLTLRYSRTVRDDGPMYLASTAVFLSEIIKMGTSIFIVWKDVHWRFGDLLATLRDEVLRKPGEMVKLAVPAVLYTIQNNLLFLALSLLDAATYQVTYQLKILTTALFSMLLLGKHLALLQWLSLVILMLGVALVQMPAHMDTGHAEALNTDHTEGTISQSLLGLVVVLIASCSSGFAGVYFEKILKGSKQSLWLRNIQLSFFGVLFGFVGVLSKDLSAIRKDGFFQGYSRLIWTVVVLQAIGGLVIATVVKYADNILKGFATSLSLVLSATVSFYLLDDLKPTTYFFAGSTMVTLATFMYGWPTKVQAVVTSSTTAA